jgi:acetyl esterase/lipase
VSVVFSSATAQASSTTTTVLHSYPQVTTSTTFAQIEDNPAFAGFATFMLPAEAPATVKALGVASIGVLHTAVQELQYWDPQTIVNGYNFLIDEINAGVDIWHPIYTAKQIAADPSKKDTGMWFFPGDPGKPLAVIAAGGGFQAVTSLQEAFPHAQLLHEMGYNVAILKYRVVSQPSNVQGQPQGQGQSPSSSQSSQTTSSSQPPQSAAQQAKIADAQTKTIEQDNNDTAAMMALIKKNAKAWHVSFKDYSVWGSSAGGQLLSGWAASGPSDATSHGFPKPAVVIDAYTPPRGFTVTKAFPATFLAVGSEDTTAGTAPVEAMAKKLKADHVPVELEVYPGVGHGFGLGTGTSAAGWLQTAVKFWKAHS